MKWCMTLLGASLLLGVLGCSRPADVELLNVSYDPTRELWRDLNREFVEHYQQEYGLKVKIRQSHGGSSSQARAVIDGLQADVVTLALWNDTDAIRQRGLIADGWEERLPSRSLPYYSTIVLMVRKGNPRNIKDWDDLLQDGVQVVTPNPKTSGNGRLSLLAAWGAVRQRGGSEDQARDFVTRLYRQVPVLDSGARGAASTFLRKRVGDVLLTWENEAHLLRRESRDTLEIVYPRSSIRAEPHVAVVDDVVDRKGTRGTAEEYLRFLYSEKGQQTIARHHYRPDDARVLAQHADRLPPIELFSVAVCASDSEKAQGFGWAEAQQKFFADGAIFDQIFRPAGR